MDKIQEFSSALLSSETNGLLQSKDTSASSDRFRGLTDEEAYTLATNMTNLLNEPGSYFSSAHYGDVLSTKNDFVIIQTRVFKDDYIKIDDWFFTAIITFDNFSYPNNSISCRLTLAEKKGYQHQEIGCKIVVISELKKNALGRIPYLLLIDGIPNGYYMSDKKLDLCKETPLKFKSIFSAELTINQQF